MFKNALQLFNIKEKFQQSDILILSPYSTSTQVYSIEERPNEIRKQLLMKNPKCLELLLVIDNNDKQTNFEDDLFFQDDSEAPNCEINNDIIHINDILVSLFYVSDSLVREIYCKNLNMCGKALPFILPNREILLWPLQDISKTFKCYKDSIKHVKVNDYQSPIISFVRLGDINNFSKSELINGLFFKESNVFLSKKITSQQSSPVISQGLIEIAWYCPEHTLTSDLEENNPIKLDKNMITILNLRGDSNKFPEQLNIIRKFSDLIIILAKDKKHLDIPNFSDDDPKLIVISNDNIPNIKDKRLVTRIPQLNNEFNNKFKSSILRNLYSDVKNLKKLTIENLINLIIENKSLKYTLDLKNEILLESYYKAKEFIDFIKDKKKNEVFKLGDSELWGKYVKNTKDLNRLSNVSSTKYNIEKHKIQLTDQIEKIRITQQKLASDLSSPIYIFIKNLLNLTVSTRIYK